MEQGTTIPCALLTYITRSGKQPCSHAVTIIWTSDPKQRLVATDPRTGTLYRVAEVRGRWQLAVYLQGDRKSCDRHLLETVKAATDLAEARISHDAELVNLARTTKVSTVRTPWGRARSITVYADGIDLVSTADRDGFRLAPSINETIPDHLRLEDGWYDEDEAGFRVILALPEHFTGLEVDQAEKALMDLNPDLHELHFGDPPGMRL